MKKSMKQTCLTLFSVLLLIGLMGQSGSQILSMNASSPVLNKIISRSTQAEYDLLIITADEYIPALRPLVDHKNAMGMKTMIMGLSSLYIEIGSLGRDEAEKIKYFIKESHETWGIDYVLLVGDFQKMPMRYVYNNEPSEYEEPRYISELYYADIYDSQGGFSSWNKNENEYFGEWIGNPAEDADIDLYPDIAVGRLACRNENEVNIVVQKIITYETETFASDWFHRFVVVAGDTYPPGQYPFDTSPFEGEENTLHAIENMSGFEIIKLWTSTGAFKGPKDVISTMNQGCGFMFFDGHASPIAWGTHPPEIENNGTWAWGLKNTHIPLLRNREKLPIIVAGACHNAQFDVTPLNLLKYLKGETVHPGEWAMECWAWKLASHPLGGSIATLANSGLGMSKEDKQSREGAGDYMDLQFFYVYGNEDVEYLGEVWKAMVTRYIDRFPVDWNNPAGSDAAIDAKTPQQWTLLGDPSLRIGGYPNQYLSK